LEITWKSFFIYIAILLFRGADKGKGKGKTIPLRPGQALRVPGS